MNTVGRKRWAIAITTYFEDREPVGPYMAMVDARRTLHLRFNSLTDPEPIPNRSRAIRRTPA